MRVPVLDQTKPCCPLLDHGTVNRCNYCKATIAKLQSISTVEVAFAWYFVENIFSKRCAFWFERKYRHIFPQYMDDLCSEDGCSVYDKKYCCVVTWEQKDRFCDATFCFNKSTTYEPPYMVTPNCLWSVGCQIVSLLKFSTGASAKLKRGYVKRYAVALSV